MRFISLAILSLFTLFTAAAAQAQDWRDNPAVPVDLRAQVRDSFIFVFGNDVAREEVAGRANTLTTAAGGRVTHVYSASIRGFSAKMSSEAAARLAARNPSIAYYEADNVAFASGKPSWAGGGGGDTTACDPQVTPWGVARVSGGIAGASGTAWVIDTGIDPDHPDIAGLVDRRLSINFASGKQNAYKDGNGHGTHVAGTIAALDNDCDVIGVAPGASLVAVRVLGNSGIGSYADVIAGVDYVAANGQPGDVANMSLGGGFSQAVNDAVEAAAADVAFALAAGNESTDANTKSPASANGPNIYTVSAINSSDNFASFSNFGNPPIECAAPGVNVLSLAKGGGTVSLSGTSMAAPHVAGMLLLGAPVSDGFAINDPDNNPDPICHN